MILGLRDLCKQIVVIPQNSFLFSDSSRDNFDPYGDHTDQEIYKAFGENYLNIIIETGDDLRLILSEKNGIFLRGRNSGCCAARAALRMNKIVIIGETTSNIDNDTDLIIQNIARNN